MRKKDKIIEKLIKNIYEKLFKKIFTKNNIKKDLKNGKEIEKIIKVLEDSKEFKSFCKKYANKISRLSTVNSKDIFDRYYEQFKKRETSLKMTFSEFKKEIYKKTINNNYKMIKSIPEKQLKVYKEKSVEVLMEEVLEGNKPRGSFEALLKEKGVKNAKLIARTETAKLQTAVDQDISEELGSICYIWNSSNDQRTRESHKKMNGVVVFWRNELKEKPLLDDMYGNAGEFPNCRCSPLSIFDETDLTSSNYRVYNYKRHKIENKSKKQLLELIKNGGF